MPWKFLLATMPGAMRFCGFKVQSIFGIIWKAPGMVSGAMEVMNATLGLKKGRTHTHFDETGKLEAN